MARGTSKDFDTESVVSAVSSRGMCANPADEVNKWLERMELRSVLVKPIGVQRHHAENAESKLRAKGFIDDASKLKQHLKLVALAELLHQDRIFGIDDQDYTGAVTALSKKLTFPSTVQRNMVMRSIEKSGKMIYDEDSFMKVLRVAWPWQTTSWAAAPVFDPKDPICSNMDTTMDEKVEVFANYFWKGPVTKIIAGASSSTSLCQNCISAVLGLTEKAVAAAGDMQDGEAALSSELLTCCRGLICFLCPHKLVGDPDLEIKLGDVKSLEEARDVDDSLISQITMLALEDVEPFMTNAELLVQKKVALLEFAPMTTTHFEALDGAASDDNLHAATVTLLTLLEEVPKTLHGLGEKLRVPYEARVVNGVQKLTEKILKVSEQAGDVLELLKSCSKILSEASNCFPMDGDISQLVSDVGARLASVSHKSTIDSFLELAAGTKTESDLSVASDDLVQAIVKLQGVPVSEEALGQGVRLLSLVHMACIEFLGTERLQKVLVVGQKLSEMIPNNLHPANAASLKVFLKAEEIQSLTGSLTEEVLADTAIDMEKAKAPWIENKVSSLKQHVVEMQSIIDKAKAASAGLVCLEKVVEGSNKLLSDICDASLKEVEKAANDLASVFKGYAGGIDGGRWKDALSPSASYQQVMKVAEKTIKKESRVAGMKAKFEKLEKASRETLLMSILFVLVVLC